MKININNKIIMKKNYLYILAAAAIFAACSNGDNFDEIKGGDNTPSVPVEDSEIEVVFGKATTATVEQAKTRAALSDSWNNEQIAIWGVDRAPGAAWNTPDSHLFGQTSPVTATVAAGGTVTFKDGPYYYPMSSAISYSFYSCYPVPANNQVSGNPSAITCTYAISGKEDIMWGAAEGKDVIADGVNYSGFNALYFRKIQNAEVPNLKFQHCLTRLNFKALTGTGYGETTPVAIKNIKVLNVPTGVRLAVAGNGAGVLSTTGAIGDMSLYNGDIPMGDDLIVPPTSTDKKDAASLGTVLLMPSQTGVYDLSVTLVGVDSDGNPITQEITGPVKIENKNGFVAGTQYNVILTAYGLQIVKVEATMGTWGNGDDITQEIN